MAEYKLGAPVRVEKVSLDHQSFDHSVHPASHLTHEFLSKAGPTAHIPSLVRPQTAMAGRSHTQASLSLSLLSPQASAGVGESLENSLQYNSRHHPGRLKPNHAQLSLPTPAPPSRFISLCLSLCVSVSLCLSVSVSLYIYMIHIPMETSYIYIYIYTERERGILDKTNVLVMSIYIYIYMYMYIFFV